VQTYFFCGAHWKFGNQGGQKGGQKTGPEVGASGIDPGRPLAQLLQPASIELLKVSARGS
jgi:hypothetical protein